MIDINIKRLILRISLGTGLVLLVLTAGIGSYNHRPDPLCETVSIVLTDSAERRFVTEDEMRSYLRQQSLWPVGEKMSDISCARIESSLLNHPMLRTAECYKRPHGELVILLSQRRPLMRVEADEFYYVDTDRRIMPLRASVDVPVIVVKGHIGKQQALGEMFDFVCQLRQMPYWKDEITLIRVVNPKHIELEQPSHKYTIILGSIDNAEQRLQQLHTLYTKGFDHIGWPDYKQIDLRFNGQIVGRKAGCR